MAPFIHLLSTSFQAAPSLALHEPLQLATFAPIFSRSKIALNQLQEKDFGQKNRHDL
jgi:hypothetical protein